MEKKLKDELAVIAGRYHKQWVELENSSYVTNGKILSLDENKGEITFSHLADRENANRMVEAIKKALGSANYDVIAMEPKLIKELMYEYKVKYTQNKEITEEWRNRNECTI